MDEFAGYVGTCVDVTGEREGTAALERTVEHLRLVATHADEMIYRLRIRPHRHLEYISPGVARVLGLSPADVMDAPLKAHRAHPSRRSRAAARSDGGGGRSRDAGSPSDGACPMDGSSGRSTGTCRYSTRTET